MRTSRYPNQRMRKRFTQTPRATGAPQAHPKNLCILKRNVNVKRVSFWETRLAFLGLPFPAGRPPGALGLGMWTIYALYLSFALEPVQELSPEVGVREKQLEAQPSELKVTYTAEQNLSYTMPAEQEFDSLRRVTANPYADVLHPKYAHYANPVQLRATKSAKTMPAGQVFDSLRRVTNISR